MLKLKLSGKARTAIAAQRRPAVRLTLKLTDAHGRKTTAVKKLRLKVARKARR